jgi:hypothetical protein
LAFRRYKITYAILFGGFLFLNPFSLISILNRTIFMPFKKSAACIAVSS